MLTITPNIHFNGQCQEAIRIYEKAFGAEVTCLLRNSDADPQDWQAEKEEMNRVYHAEIVIGGQRIMMTDDTAPSSPPGNTVSLVVTFETADAVKAAFQVLSEGAVVITPMHPTTYSSCMSSLIDRFGMRWELMTEQTEV